MRYDYLGDSCWRNKGNQSWIFIGRTDAEPEAPVLWPPDTKSILIRKDHDAGKDWRQGEKGTTEDEMVGWHHWLNGRELKQAPGIGNGQGSLPCCSPWGGKELDMTEWPKNSNKVVEQLYIMPCLKAWVSNSILYHSEMFWTLMYIIDIYLFFCSVNHWANQWKTKGQNSLPSWPF